MYRYPIQCAVVPLFMINTGLVWKCSSQRTTLKRDLLVKRPKERCQRRRERLEDFGVLLCCRLLYFLFFSLRSESQANNCGFLSSTRSFRSIRSGVFIHPFFAHFYRTRTFVFILKWSFLCKNFYYISYLLSVCLHVMLQKGPQARGCTQLKGTFIVQ